MFKKLLNTEVKGLKIYEIIKGLVLMAVFWAISIGSTIWLLMPAFFLWVRPEDDSVWWFILITGFLGTMICGVIYCIVETLYISVKRYHR